MAIDPNLIPTINPGSLFTTFTDNNTYNIRWLTATDPAYFEVLNRPLYDITVRQLIIAKALDNLDTSLGYQALFPFIIPPQVTDGSVIVNVPVRTFWDTHVSVAGGIQTTTWSNLRLARIDRLTGTNGTGTYTGELRFIFTAQKTTGGIISATETAIFYADYTIDSPLTYQRVRIVPATAAACPGFTAISVSEWVTIDGEIIFRTLDQSSVETQTFYDLLAPGSNAYYEIVDSNGSLSDPDFDPNPISHGSGMLSSNAYNLVTPVDADPTAWLNSFNYPFSLDATRESGGSFSVTIPTGLFNEFNVVAPASDLPTGSTSAAFFPVWISRVVRDGSVTTPTLIFYLSTYGISPVSNTPVEFASFTLTVDMLEGQIVEITPESKLYTAQTSALWNQDFGRGHVALSGKWTGTGGEVSNFFDSFPLVIGSDTTATFSLTATRVASWGISRVPQYSPTAGQSAALAGSGARFNTPKTPSDVNRYSQSWMRVWVTRLIWTPRVVSLPMRLLSGMAIREPGRTCW